MLRVSPLPALRDFLWPLAGAALFAMFGLLLTYVAYRRWLRATDRGRLAHSLIWTMPAIKRIMVIRRNWLPRRRVRETHHDVRNRQLVRFTHPTGLGKSEIRDVVDQQHNHPRRP